MEITRVEHKQPLRKANIGLATAAGAVAGNAMRYVLPSKNAVNLKQSADEFVKSASLRAQNRSILKYAGIGALVCAGLSYAASKVFPFKKQDNPETIPYSKYGALIDSNADSAYAVIYYGE